ncbi:MAG: hypothetical protein AB7T27_04900 [Kiritimatiellia bacterium]
MSKVEMDLSAFMNIIIMAIGCMVVILVVNMVIIVSNPENVEIMSLVRGAYEEYGEEQGAYVGQPIYANKTKEPFYIDVHADRVILYPEIRELALSELEIKGNAFEQLLDLIEPLKSRIYVILVLRPKSSRVAKQLRRALHDRGIDVGHELYEAGRKIPELKAPDVAAVRAALGMAAVPDAAPAAATNAEPAAAEAPAEPAAAPPVEAAQ